MVSTLIDIIILLVLAFFAWRGGRKGLILTLFSLFALFAAWFGAKAVTANFSEPVANIIRPSIQLKIDDVISSGDIVVEADPDPAPTPSVPSVVLPGGPTGADATQAPSSSDGFSLQQILDVIEQSELYTGLRSYLDEAVADNTLQIATSASAAVSSYLALLIARALLFGASFLLILLIWFLVSRALDLGFRLPILAPINIAGGALLGLAKGIALMLILVWLAGLAGLISDDTAGPVARLMTIESLSNLLRSLIQGAEALTPAAALIYHVPILDLFTNI